jgi:uncharacterized protein (TIGR00369 family)
MPRSPGTSRVNPRPSGNEIGLIECKAGEKSRLRMDANQEPENMDRQADEHYRALEKMYRAAPINVIFRPSITVAKERAEIEMAVTEAFFHSAGALHGSVYFKMLDDAAFFAANSIVRDNFVLTASFTTYLTRPVTSGTVKSIGKVVSRGRSQIIAEAVVWDGQGREVGRGNGIFVRSKLPLAEALGYGGTGHGNASSET